MSSSFEEKDQVGLAVDDAPKAGCEERKIQGPIDLPGGEMWQLGGGDRDYVMPVDARALRAARREEGTNPDSGEKK